MNAAGRVRLIHWNEAEAAEKAGVLAAAGWSVDATLPPGPVLFRELRQSPPDLIVIDLSRLPSQGRDVALTIRHAASTRLVPIVFIEGDPQKTAGVRQHLPDAVFTTWKGIHGAMRHAREHPLADPVKPASVFAGYSGTPLPKKLGIKPGMSVGTVGAPEDLPAILGALPEGARLQSGTRGRPGLVLWFVRSESELGRNVAAMAGKAGEASMWIAWQKKASREKRTSPGARASAAHPTEKSVRAAGLGVGLVDFKVCAIDETWSGLLFTRRRGR